jgi:hypothetical protein
MKPVMVLQMVLLAMVLQMVLLVMVSSMEQYFEMKLG